MLIEDISQIEAPQFLGKEGYVQFMETAKQLVEWGILYKVDLFALAAMCAAWERYLKLGEVIQDEGFLITDKNGDKRGHPAVREQRQQLDVYLTIAKRFGCTPLDRQKIIEAINKGSREGSQRGKGNLSIR